LKVFASEIENCIPNVVPGCVVTDHKKYLKIALSDGFIHLKQVQQAGKKAMPIDDFLRGTQLNGSWKTTL
jgi:methionyl-tRNA formyltransferase